MSIRRYAQVVDGVVANLAVADPDHLPEWMDAGWVDVTDTGVARGWTWDAGEFIPPPAPEGQDEV